MGRARTKTLKMTHCERRIDGDVQENCRRWEKIDESNVALSKR
jgi:hypothetical protein